jgi:hypothetical protein
VSVPQPADNYELLERAAIREYDGKQPRHIAEHNAKKDRLIWNLRYKTVFETRWAASED